MIRIITALAALSLASPASAAERRYTVTDFDRIQVDGPFQVSVLTGRPPSGLASGDQQGIERVSIEVQGRILRIRPNRSWGGYPGENAGAVKLVVSTHGLRSAAVNGSGSLTIDKAKAMKFDAGLSGSGRIEIGRLEADALVLGLTGGGKLVVGGTAKTLRATISGSGDLDAAALAVEDADINADTSGLVAIAARRSAKINATGAGDVTVDGRPACTVEQSGAGRVSCGKQVRSAAGPKA
jgi:DNA-binding transcriptional regulator YdaS (Cro superfamily)